MPKLMDLLPPQFKWDLTKAERLILKKAPTGKWADMRSGDKEFDDPANANKWPELRSVRAKFLEWLLRNKKARDLIHDKGILISGIRIDGELDLYSLTFPFSLTIQYSYFANDVDLRFARMKLIDFSNSRFENFLADGLDIELTAHFKNSISEGKFRLVAANIGGNLGCQGTKFINEKGDAFDGDTMTTKGTVFLDEIKSISEFRLVGANIGGYLSCTGANFINEKGNAFNGDRITTKETVFLDGIESTGDFRLVGANIGASLQCNGAKFINKNGESFYGDRITTKGSVFLQGIESTVDFRLVGATIGGNLECKCAKFMNKNGWPFNGDRIATKGDVFLTQIESTGDFRLVNANIGSNLDCTGAKFMNEKGDAFSGDRISTKGEVFLSGIESKSEFSLIGANIRGDLYCDGASFQNKRGTALQLMQAQIEGRLCLDDIKKIDGTINLKNTKASALRDDAESWPHPEKGNLILDGFEYDSFAEATPTEIDKRLEWLKLQPQKKYFPQPYQQLAKVYRKMGRDRDAKKVLLEKERMRRKFGDIGELAKLWCWFLDKTIGYGYQIGKALGIVAVIIALGAFIFGFSNCYNIIQWTSEGTTERALVEFSPLFYSIDVFVPFLDLRQESSWVINANMKWGGKVQLYYYFHIISGWVFSSLLVAGFTGLIRRE